MVKQIIRDRFFLRQKSEEATEKDKEIITDLRDTLTANEDRCIGMAANMIGKLKRIIVVALPFGPMVMINPDTTIAIKNLSRKPNPSFINRFLRRCSAIQKFSAFFCLFHTYV